MPFAIHNVGVRVSTVVEDESGFRNLAAEFHSIGKFGGADAEVEEVLVRVRDLQYAWAIA